jgi:hypothetical protein
MTNTLAYYNSAKITDVKFFIIHVPDYIRSQFYIFKFCTIFTSTFGKLDHFSARGKTCTIMKRASLPKEREKLIRESLL